MARSPIRPTNDAARELARGLLANARYAALAVLHPETGAPFVSRAALGLTPYGQPMTLISTLSLHTRALHGNPLCSLLVGEPPTKGDPLAFPRLTLSAQARFVVRPSDEHESLRDHYLQSHPKSALYVDFGDFNFVVFEALSAALNGGFGKAYDLLPSDLTKKDRGAAAPRPYPAD